MTGFQSSVERLRQHYGQCEQGPLPGNWYTLVRVVLEKGPTGKLTDSQIADSCLNSPSNVRQAHREEIARVLARVGYNRQKASALKLLAEWWYDHFGDELEPVWNGSQEQYQMELRQLRGISIEMTDRILLFVAGFPVYPLDRGSIRIACRHGWIGFEADYEEWQSFFQRELHQAGSDAREFSHWAIRLGREHCGPTPRCDQCPLEPLLPECGPYEPQDG